MKEFEIEKKIVSENVRGCVSSLVDLLDGDGLTAIEKLDDNYYRDNDYYDEENDEYVEIMEYWLVTPWLGSKLAEKGEIVWHDNYSFALWGRQTSGQAIFLDGVIEEIAKDLKEVGA